MKLKILRTEQPSPKVIKAKTTTKKVKKTRRVWNPVLGKYTWKKIKPRVTKPRVQAKTYKVSVNLDEIKVNLDESTALGFMCSDCYSGLNWEDDHGCNCKLGDIEEYVSSTHVGNNNWDAKKQKIKEHGRKVRVILAVDLLPKDIEFLDVALKPSASDPLSLPRSISSRIEV